MNADTYVQIKCPIFILGLHRSGTTWLYEMLARTGSFDILTAYHVICFGEYLLGRRNHEAQRIRLGCQFESMGLKCRGGEAVQLSSCTPEEYGFILDNYSGALHLRRENYPLFRQIARMIWEDTRSGRRLLLKNPWDFGNAQMIKSLLPEAKFIFIHRNPFHVLSSMQRLVVSTVNDPDPYTAMLHDRYRRLKDGRIRRHAARWCVASLPGLVVTGLLRWVQRATANYLRNLSAIPCEDRIDVSYESLCEDANGSMARILSFLDCPSAAVDYKPLVAFRDRPVAAVVAQKRSLIVRKLADYSAAVGYDLPSLAKAL